MKSIDSMFLKVNQLIGHRAQERIGAVLDKPEMKDVSVDDMVRRFEIPSHFRTLFNPEKKSPQGSGPVFSISEAFDQLSFPALYYFVMGGARFMSAKVLHHDRETVQEFSKNIGKYTPPSRVLWLTDTLHDRNGVASVLKMNLEEVRRLDLPVDFLVCNNEMKSGSHLHVVPSLGSFCMENFSEQKFEFPNLMDIHKIFYEGGYDRIVVSTEALMGVVGLYLKKAFNVKAYFYMHTDWLDYAKRMTNLDEHGIDRVRRIGKKNQSPSGHFESKSGPRVRKTVG